MKEKVDFKKFLETNLKKENVEIEVVHSSEYEHRRKFPHFLVRFKFGKTLDAAAIDLIVCDYQAMEMQSVYFSDETI